MIGSQFWYFCTSKASKISSSAQVMVPAGRILKACQRQYLIYHPIVPNLPHIPARSILKALVLLLNHLLALQGLQYFSTAAGFAVLESKVPQSLACAAGFAVL